ncbi:MAG: lysylphosphatidylglycerol synthase domain-containing protein, partial [Terriglobia bacterium]
FLQAVNQVAGGTALILFMRRRKGIPVLSASATMVFLALVDFLLMGMMGVTAAILVPNSFIGSAWYYPAGATVCLGLIAWFWMRGRPSSTVARWIYDRPSLESFREARVSHYVRLILIRAPIFILQGVTLYFELRSFGVHVPFRQVMAFEPAELFLSALPITPAGLGVLQAVLIFGFQSYGSRADLLTMGLAISTMGIILRLPLGIGSVGALARDLIHGREAQPAVLAD